jgi:hypothetical protein
MTISSFNNSQQKTAKLIGLAYLFTFIIVVCTNYGIYDRLNVPGNPEATAAKILNNEFLFRTGIVADLFYALGFIVLFSCLYAILKTESNRMAMTAVILHLVYVIVWVALTMKFYDALRLMKSPEYLNTFSDGNLFSLSKLFLNTRFDRYYGVLMFYSLGSVIFNTLWYKSGFIPRGLAIWGIIASAWCTICAIAYLIYPDYELIINPWLFDLPMAFFDMTLSFWLLTKGLRQNT